MEHSVKVHNSRRPFDRLILTLTLIFDLIFVGRRGIVMEYPCAKFGDFSFSRFGFNVRTGRQTDRITEADDRFIHATTEFHTAGSAGIEKVTSPNYSVSEVGA